MGRGMFLIVFEGGGNHDEESHILKEAKASPDVSIRKHEGLCLRVFLFGFV